MMIAKQFGDIILPGRRNTWQLFVTEEVANKVLEINTSLTSLSLPIEYIKVIDLKDIMISPFNEKKVW